jgi:ABC-type dipeptide/oligopeptide/nickel transport system permease subunit
MVGFAMLSFLLGLVVVVPFVAPFDVAQGWGHREIWVDNPRDAAPEWVEWFSGKRLARTSVMQPCYPAASMPIYNNTGSEPCPGGGWDVLVQRTSVFEDFMFIEMEQTFDFDADVFPSELSAYVWAAYGLGPPPPRVTLSFQSGDGGARSATDDAYVRNSTANISFGFSTRLLVDADGCLNNGTCTSLIKFGDFIGTAADQVPFGATIIEAILEITVTSAGGTQNVYQVVDDWDEATVTWNTTPKAKETAALSFLPSVGRIGLNLTSVVHDWTHGEANQGILIATSSPNGTEYASSESANPPKLTLTFTPPPIAPLIYVELRRPDNVNFTLLQIGPDFRAPAANTYALSTDRQARWSVHESVRNWAITTYGAQDVNLVRPEVTLFAQGGPEMLDSRRAKVLKGQYTMYVELSTQGVELGLDAKVVVFGTVHGIAGTDSSRRDLLVGLLWGAPVALAFGSVAAVVVVVLQTVLGALGAWYGGWWDEIVQRSADILLILPLLPILLLIATLYDPSIWSLLLVVIGLGFVGSTSKVARSIVLQVKEEAYVEAAVSYGASRARILFKHILPRMLPYTFALIALAVPAFIFLEASISFLGFGDPNIPSWGSVLGEAYRGNATFNGFWWWIAFPAIGIVFTTVAFALLGYSFDKVLNPRLREQ